MISNTQAQAGGGSAQGSPGPQASQDTGQLAPGTITYAFQPDQFLLPEEDRTEFVRFSNALWERLAPSGMLEKSLAARIVSLSWRLQRAGRFDQYVVQAAKDGRAQTKKRGRGRPAKLPQLTDGEAIAYLLMQTRAYATISGYEGHLARCLHRDLKMLWALQKVRIEETARRAHLLSGQRQ